MERLRNLCALIIMVCTVVTGVVAPVFTALALWQMDRTYGKVAFILWMVNFFGFPLAKFIVK